MSGHPPSLKRSAGSAAYNSQPPQLPETRLRPSNPVTGPFPDAEPDKLPSSLAADLRRFNTPFGPFQNR